MVQLVIVAHSPLATALQQVAAHAFPDRAACVAAVDVEPNEAPEAVEARLQLLLAGSAETLLMTDVFGATPCSAALRVVDSGRVRVLCGVNVPMLWRALCYNDQPLDKLIGMAQSGATHGVMQVANTRPQNQLVKVPAHAADDTQNQ